MLKHFLPGKALICEDSLNPLVTPQTKPKHNSRTLQQDNNNSNRRRRRRRWWRSQATRSLSRLLTADWRGAGHQPRMAHINSQTSGKWVSSGNSHPDTLRYCRNAGIASRWFCSSSAHSSFFLRIYPVKVTVGKARQRTGRT